MRPARIFFPSLLLFLTSVALSSSADGQNYLTQAGSPTFTSAWPVELGYVNVGNGNLHNEITIASVPQRGGRPFASKMVYDSRIWQIDSSNSWQPTNIPNSQGGWRFVTSVDPGVVNYLSGTTTCIVNNARVPSGDTYVNFSWTAPDGTQHFFPIYTRLKLACGVDIPNGSAHATDSSGFDMWVTKYTQATVLAPDGTQVYPSTKDTNGNYFSTDSNANVIDTLGRTPVTHSANGSQTTYAVLNSQGSRSSYIVTTESINVSTGFGVSGVKEYSGTLTVVKSLQLPDGTSYSFGYDSYGELNSITVPTGGTIAYGYGNFTDGLSGVNRWVASHSSGGGTTTFGQAVVANSNCPSGAQACQTQSVTKPDNSQAIYTFSINNGAWKSSVQYKSGGSPNIILGTVSDTWNFSVSCQLQNCTGSENIQKLTEITTFPVSSQSVTKQLVLTYDSINDQNVTKIQEWNFYTGSLPTNPDRETDFTYQTASAYKTKNIVNRVLSSTVKDGSGNLVAQTNYSYDDPSTLTGISGIAQHDDSNFGIADTTRGNLTKIQRCTNLAACGSSYLQTALTYDTTGQVLSVQDPAGNTTSFAYADNFFNDPGDGPSNPPQGFTAPQPTNAYLTKVTPQLIPASTFGYYWGTGQRSFSTDANSASEYFHYFDSMSRPTSTVLPNSGWTYDAYPSETEVDVYKGITGSFAISGCTGCRHDQILLDNLGRLTSSILVSDPEGQTTTATSYDSSGRVATVSHPYRSTSDVTYGLETPGYDGLNRTTQVKHQDNTIAYTYYGGTVSGGGGITTQLCSSVGAGFPVLSVDEAGHKTEVWVDGFGRTVETDEPNSTGTLAVGTCSTYDLNNNLISVKNATQTRSFSYDAASRLTSSSTPEAGTVSFSYDSDSNCSAPNSFPGHLVKRVDARGIRTCFQYDQLNRLTAKNYSDSTIAVSYFYDQTSYNGLTIANGKGRRTGMSDGSGQTAWSYNSVGAIVTEQRTISGRTKSFSYSYNLDGSPYSITYPSGRTVNYSVSNAERLLSATDSGSGFQYAILASYGAPGNLQSVIYGRAGTFNGVTESRALNNRLEMTSVQASSAAATALNLAFGYPAGNNGDITAITDNRDNGRSLPAISYDQLDRISGTKTQSTTGADCWGQGFTPDSLSNLSSITATQCTAGTLSATVNANNQFTPQPTYAYDASGNMTADGTGYAYSFDAENLLKTATGTPSGNYTYTYDGNGLRVAKSNGSTATLYWRGLSGDALTETDSAGDQVNDYVFFAGRRIAAVQPGIQNPGFEAGSYDWSLIGGQIITDPTRAHSGSNYVQLTAATGGGAFATQSSWIIVHPGQVISTFGGWVYPESGSSQNWGWTLAIADANHKLISATSLYNTPPIGTWTLQAGTNVTVPSNGVYAYMYCQVYKPTASTVLRCDDGYLNADGILFYNADQAGTTRTITDSAGNVCYDADFTPYGQEIVQHTNSCPQNYKFTGYERDPETGLDYAFARYYSASLGRFLSPDPAGGSLADPQSLNRYAYTRNNPANLIDPSGMINIPGYGRGGAGAGFLGQLLNISLGILANGNCFGCGWNEFDVMQIPVYAWGFFSRTVPGPNGDGTTTVGVWGYGLVGYGLLLGNSGTGGPGHYVDVKRLQDCLDKYYSLTMTSFVESQEGANGTFVAQNSSGKFFSVTNDVKKFSTFQLQILSFGGGGGGYTGGLPPFSANLNYTANDITQTGGAGNPVAVPQTQVHELAHSLDILTSGNPFGSSEYSANKFENCVFRYNDMRPKR